MKKKILAAALASVMAFTNVSALFAEGDAAKDAVVDLGDLTVTTFCNEKTDAIELKSGDSYTLKFNNKSNGENFYDNFVLFVTGVPANEFVFPNDEALALAVRADNFGWGGGLSDFGDLSFDSNIAWENWVAGAKEGYDVNIALTRTGDTIKYDAAIGEYYVRLTATSSKALPETLYAFLTGENCVLSGITATKSSAEPEEPEEPEQPEVPEGSISLGDLTVTTFCNEKTDAIELKSGDSYTLKFNNKSNGENFYDNFVLFVTGVPANEFVFPNDEALALAVRADNFGWGGGLSDFGDLSFDSNIAWENWVAGAKEGYDVNIALTRTGDTIKYDAAIGEYYVRLTATSSKALPETLYAFLTGENCVLSGITATKNTAEPDVPDVPDEPDEPDVPEIPEGAVSLGNLTVTGFFNEKTDVLELKSGESYTFKFGNKSNGTNNYENFVMAVAGATGEAYKGADQEVLVVRADSWGWGGGMSDFVAPDQSGNKLSFDNNITDWAAWAAGAREGYDVDLTISRYNNTIAYEAIFSSRAKAGDYYVKLKATSGKALPESLYVFFTGENCVLSNIIATKGTGVVLEENKPAAPPAPTFSAPATPAAAELGETNTISNDLTVTSFFAEKTEAVTLKNGGSYTFKFNNKSNGSNNWDNFVMAVTGEIGSAYKGADQEVLVIRADSWGWGGGMSDFVAPDQAGNALVFDTNIDWDKWQTGAKAGYDVEITISRNGNTLTYDAKIGDYYVKLTATSGKALPKNTYVFFTGENCVLSGITTTNNNPAALEDTSEPEEETTTTTTAATTAPIATAAPTEATTVDLGDLTVTGFFVERTNAVELKNGGSYTFKFNNKSNGTNNWENFVLAVTGETGEAYTGADQEILVIRADSWGWGGGYSDFAAPDQAGNALVFDTNIDWDKWVAGAKAGYDVEITIGKNGNTITYDAKIGDYYVKLTATSGKALPESAYVFFTGENCVLSGITATNNNPTASDNTTSAPQNTTTAPQATTAQQDTTVTTEAAKKPAAPVSLGNLTVTNFFNEKTDTVKLRSGDSYSFKFNNKSNGTNNWDNFILAIAGETGAAYTGADQEVLIIRADNWGWGGGYSDFVSPDQAGNALVFDTNIDWDKWVAGAQAGYDVNITLTRSGNTLKYYATIGDYYVKLTATSGKALPETLYVFLTGENCVLSGITATSLNDVSPNTGIAAPCTVVVLAMASAAAIVVLKKKSAK